MTEAFLSGAVSHNLDELSRALTDYGEVTGKTAGQVVEKKGKQLTYELFDRFKEKAPARGQIFQEAEARGFRVKVRDSVLQDIFARNLGPNAPGERVRGGETRRRLNFSAQAVKRELAVRESGRRFTAIGWNFRGWRPVDGDTTQGHAQYFSRSKYGFEVGRVQLDIKADGASALLQNSAPGAKEADEKYNLVAPAIEAITKDTVEYAERKAAENANRVLAGIERSVFKR